MSFHSMTIDNIICKGDAVRIDIGYAIIVKNMEDADQDTRWYGKGVLKISELVIESDQFPSLPAQVETADIKNNQITYRDEVVFPFKYHGNVGISLKFEDFDSPVKFIGEHMELDVSGHEKYLEHIS